MGKKTKSQSVKPNASEPAPAAPFLGAKASIDPSLASLFEQSVRIYLSSDGHLANILFRL